MGVNKFIHAVKASNPRQAFIRAINEAEDKYGRCTGHTGSIANKSEYKLLPLPKNADPYDHIEAVLIDKKYQLEYSIQESWGPAGCIKGNNHEFIFFGYARN